MPTPCRMIVIVARRHQMNGFKATRWVDSETNERPVAGDMFYAPHLIETSPRDSFSKQFMSEAGMMPLVVVLPGGQWWCVDQRAYKHPEGYHGDGWTVTGKPPNITATPSINTREYHGHLTNGVLTDDLGGHVS